MALLKPTKISTKTVSFRLPSKIVDELDAVKLKAKEAGFALDLSDQVEKLIIAAVKQASAELSGESEK